MRARLSRAARPALALVSALMAPTAGADCAATVAATIETGRGPIGIELDRAAAPKTVDNFLAYARAGVATTTRDGRRDVPVEAVTIEAVTVDACARTDNGGGAA